MDKPAKLKERLLARICDVFIFTTLGYLILFFTFGDYDFSFETGIISDVIYTTYLIILPVLWNGYVIGKRICNIKILQTNNNQVQLRNTIMRELVGFHLIGILTLGMSLILSVFMIMYRKDGRSIHDFIGDTYVKSNN